VPEAVSAAPLTAGPEWRLAAAPVAYEAAVAEMDARAAAIRDGGARELVWLLEHPPLYTAGTSARADDLLDPRFPVHRSGRNRPRFRGSCRRRSTGSAVGATSCSISDARSSHPAM